MKEIRIHTFEERMNGINDVCTLSNGGWCSGYRMIGDRACDNRHIPGFKEGDPIQICKYNKNYSTIKK